MSRRPWIFEFFRIKDIPWMPLGNFPTPVHRLMKLEEYLGYSEIWIKRDDKSSDIYGGNKVRKFEFVLANAKKKKAKWIMTFGGLGSNQTLAMTIYASRLGIKTIAVLVDQPITEYVLKNLWLMHYFGAKLVYAKNVPGAVMKAIWYKLTKRGVHIVTVGASNPLGTLGYVDAMLELKRDIENGRAKKPRKIFVAVGSCGTYAGLYLGKKLFGLDDIDIIGVLVARGEKESRKAILRLVRATYKLLKKHAEDIPSIDLSGRDIILESGYFGRCYGDPTPEGVRAIKLMSELEGIPLEPTYTGKTMAALIDYAKRREEGPLLFWNTYNSVDLSYALKDMDYKKLPKKFQKFYKLPKIDLESLIKNKE